MRVVFLGTGAIGVPSLRALAGSAEIAAVFSQPDKPSGRQMRAQPTPVKAAALDLGLPVFQPPKLRAPEAVAELDRFKADVFVVIAYGQILSKAVLGLPRLGCLNVHASLLPRHRGASPIQSAILAGDIETGITIMEMDEGLDTGPMIAKETLVIGAQETAGELHDRLALLAPQSLLRVLGDLAAGRAERIPQDSSLATYAPKLSKTDGLVVWNTPAMEIDRRMRAMLPWPGAFTHFPDGTILKLHRAKPVLYSGPESPGTVVSASAEGILVAAGEEALLLEEVQAAGGRRMAAADFLRGRELPPGSQLA